MPEATSRSLRDILKANLLTRFNALLGSLFVVILVVGPIQDAVFGLILFANAFIGIGQELRAKITLDRLAILAAPRARVVRDGATGELQVSEVVVGDLLAERDPNLLDLCREHVERMTPPVGWIVHDRREVARLAV